MLDKDKYQIEFAHAQRDRDRILRQQFAPVDIEGPM